MNTTLYNLASQTAPAPKPAKPQADIAPLSRDAVAAMRQRYRAQIAEMADKACPAEAGDDHKAAMRRLILALHKARKTPKPKQLKELASRPLEAIIEHAQQVESAPPYALHELRRYYKMATVDVAPGASPFPLRYLDGIFPDPKTHRTYLPLLSRNDIGGEIISPTHRKVVDALRGNGFSEIDYHGGYCTDDRRNRVKIGKALRQTCKDADLADAFDRDEAREKDPDKLCIVISRHPYDVLRMSTGRGWQSCMAKGGSFANHLRGDVKQGTLVAYLISRNDPEINDPLSRIALKPFRNGKGETMLMVEPMYGLSDRGFDRSVRHFVRRVANHGLSSGKYEMADGLYNDACNWEVRHISDKGMRDARTFLREFGIRHIKLGKRIWAWGDIDLNSAGLSSLPDLSNVTLYGDFRASNNQLHDLKGFPHHVSGTVNLQNNRLTHIAELKGKVFENLYLSYNNLQTLADGPARVHDRMALLVNPNLQSFSGIGEFGFMLSDKGSFGGRNDIPEALRIPVPTRNSPAP